MLHQREIAIERERRILVDRMERREEGAESNPPALHSTSHTPPRRANANSASTGRQFIVSARPFAP